MQGEHKNRWRSFATLIQINHKHQYESKQLIISIEDPTLPFAKITTPRCQASPANAPHSPILRPSLDRFSSLHAIFHVISRANRPISVSSLNLSHPRPARPRAQSPARAPTRRASRGTRGSRRG